MRMTFKRSNDVEVTTARGTTVISWASRQALLARLSKTDGAEQTGLAFEAAGATLPVILTLDQQGVVVQAIKEWCSQLDGGLDELPEGLAELYNALADPFEPSS